jgi:hypothetical protein
VACAITSLFMIAMFGIIAVGIAFPPSSKEKPSARRQETPVAPSGDDRLTLRLTVTTSSPRGNVRGRACSLPCGLRLQGVSAPHCLSPWVTDYVRATIARHDAAGRQ